MFYMRFDSSDVASAEQSNGINQQSYLVQNPTFYPNIPPLSTLALGTNIDRQIRYVIGDQLRAPYLIQSAMGLEQQLFKGTTLAVNFTNTRGVHQFRSRNINAPLPDSGIRPYGDVGHLYLYEASGLLKQSQLMVRVNTQIGKRGSLFGAYIWNDAHTNTDGLTSMPVNQYDTNAEWGRSTRHRAPHVYQQQHPGDLGGFSSRRSLLRALAFHTPSQLDQITMVTAL